ncbi:MAG: hypothetical protein HQ575_03775 [Candidatus Omnitrophica bacterium]|nr:hypothetical protein [Candidatus Omnitrophota bacterium]
MQNKKLVILIVLSIVAVGSILYGLSAPPRGETGGIVRTHHTQAEIVNAAKERIQKKRSAVRTNFVGWRRNPFVPEIKLKEDVITLTLNGILWDEIMPRAIINSDVVDIGDVIEGNRIVAINHNNVILNDGTEDFTLTLE